MMPIRTPIRLPRVGKLSGARLRRHHRRHTRRRAYYPMPQRFAGFGGLGTGELIVGTEKTRHEHLNSVVNRHELT